MQHKSGKEYDPTAWAAQRRAAVEAANKLRLERKTGAGEANDLSFSPELVARNPKGQSSHPSGINNQGSLPFEMDQHQRQKSPYNQHRQQQQQPGQQQQTLQQQQRNYSNQGGSRGNVPTVSTSLDQLASDSLDHFYAAEGNRISGPGSDPLTNTPPGKENFGNGNGGQIRMNNISNGNGFQIQNQNLSPTSDSLVQELRRQGGSNNHTNGGQFDNHDNIKKGSSPFVSKFGQELYQEGLRGKN